MNIKILKFNKVTSTNDIAINLIKRKKKSYGCVLSKLQSKGRGTHGRQWLSYKGNLFASIFFQLKKNYPPFNEFSIINPVIIGNILKVLCQTENISLKHPNDLLLNGKKFCGILQEMITFDNKKFLIIGIGINIITSPKKSKKIGFTSILKETKKKLKINTIIKKIILDYENFLINLKKYNYNRFKIEANLMSSI